MTKIKNQDAYPQDITISDVDFIIGSDGNTLTKKTKTFLLGELRNYALAGLSPLTGGTLKFDEITYTGGAYTTFAQVVNALDPNVSILQYHVVVVNLNGAKAILKLQNRLIGIDQAPVVDGDFIVLPTSVGPTGKGIVSVLKTGTVGLVDTFTITYTDATTSTFTMNNGSNGIDGVDGIDGIDGIDATLTPKTTSTFTASGTPTVLPSDFNHISFLNGITYLPATTEIGKEIVVFTYSDLITVRANVSNTNFMTIDDVNVYVPSITLPIYSSYRFIYIGSGYWKAEAIDGRKGTSNLQRDMSTSFSLSDSDNNYVIQLKNASDITITIPDTLTTSKFECGFLRKGVGEVSFIGSGTTINNPTGFRIKNQYDPAFIERDGATQIFTLLGNTKI